MTCPHCGFENREDQAKCFRCGQDLDLSGVDFVPERLKRGPSSAASRTLQTWAARLRRNRSLSQVRQQAASSPEAGGALAAALSLLIPGLGQAWQRRPLPAFLFFLGWLAAVWIAHPELGLTDLHPDLYLALVLQNLFRAATLPVSVQAAAAVDAYRQSVEGSGKRRLPVRELFLVGTLSVVLVWAWCSAVADLAGRLTGGQILMASASPLLTHDPSFKPGDDLLIQGDYYQTGGRIQAGQVALYVPPRPLGNLGGQFLATVRAGPGDRVLWRDGRLYVNGVLQNLPPAWQAALNSAGRGEQVLAGDQALLMVGLSLNPGITFEDAFIPARLLEGKAVAILNPRSHRRTLP